MLQNAVKSSAVIRQQDSPRLEEYLSPLLDFSTVLHLLPFSPISSPPSISLILMTACLEIWKLMIDTPISFLPARAKAPISQGPLFCVPQLNSVNGKMSEKAYQASDR